MKVDKETEVKDSKFIYRQNTPEHKRELTYDYKRCNGCTLCIKLCPEEALEPGPLHEIATGLDAPPVLVDADKCSFCGMCAALCPVHAMNMTIDDQDILTMEEYPNLDLHIDVNTSCLPCMLCEKTCPQDAIELNLDLPKKEDIAPFEEEHKGSINIDMDKCNYCGVCAEFCDALVLVEKEEDAVTPVDMLPFQDLVVDESKCDYCKICEDLCPEDAIKVEGELRIDKIPEIKGSITIDESKCAHSGWCMKICPYEAVETGPPFEGEIELIERNLGECDPIGCHACFNVCPTNAWYIPKEGKIAVDKDLCIHCGACEEACHLDAIKVTRSQVHHTSLSERPWTESWREAIEAIQTGILERPELERTLSPPEKKHEVIEHVPAIPEIDEKLLAQTKTKIQPLLSALNDIKTRRLWEKEEMQAAPAKILERTVKKQKKVPQ